MVVGLFMNYDTLREREIRFIKGDVNKCCFLATRGMRASTNV